MSTILVKKSPKSAATLEVGDDEFTAAWLVVFLQESLTEQVEEWSRHVGAPKAWEEDMMERRIWVI